MAHFAEIDKNNKVLRVLVVDNLQIISKSGEEDENLGIDFLQQLFGKNTNWVQTSYTNRIRGRFASADMFYNKEEDCFSDSSK